MSRQRDVTSVPTLSSRGDIRLGYRCNARCGFCYYQGLLDNPVEREPTTELLRAQILALRAQGATEVEFTGGEPTIRPDFPDLITYARELGFRNISVITNGLRLSSARYASRLISAGLNDVLFSVHGPNAAIHDDHTSLTGSFSQILKAIANVRALGARCRTSSTVTALNHEYVHSMLELFIELGVDCIHLAVFSPVASAVGTDPRFVVRYTDAARSIRFAIDRHVSRLPQLSVKYIPFCFMIGYEKYVMNLYQQNYDRDDWNYYYSNKIRRTRGPISRALFDAASLLGALFAKDWSIPLRHGLFGLKVFGFTRLVELLRKKRTSACRGCAYDLVCDHVWKEYAQQFGTSELKPVQGAKLRDPAWSYVMARYRRPDSIVGTVQLASCAKPLGEKV